MKNLINKIFSEDEVNTGRQIEFDIAKATSVFFMVLIHTWIYLSSDYEISGTVSNFIVGILCSLFGASLFMMCMGIGFDYTKNRDNPYFFMLRGIRLFGLAYLLNVVRSFINVFITAPYIYGSFRVDVLFFSWLNVDILQFAGLALFVFGIFKKLGIKPWSMFFIAFGLAVIAKFIPMFSTGNAVFDLLLGTIFPDGFLDTDALYSYFPLLNYLLFPMFGYAYGIFYKRIKDKNLYYTFVLPITGIISIGYAILATKYQWAFVASEIEYYHMSFYNSLICILSGIFIIGVYYCLSLLLPKRIFPFISKLSSDINRIYCIHWVILYNLFGILSYYINEPGKGILTVDLGEGLAFIIGLEIYIMSVLLAKIYGRYKEKHKKKNAIL